jgi:hypothetical protein
LIFNMRVKEGMVEACSFCLKTKYICWKFLITLLLSTLQNTELTKDGAFTHINTIQFISYPRNLHFVQTSTTPEKHAYYWQRNGVYSLSTVFTSQSYMFYSGVENYGLDTKAWSSA